MLRPVCPHTIEFLGILRNVFVRVVKLKKQRARWINGRQMLFPFNVKWISHQHSRKSNLRKVRVTSESSPYILHTSNLFNNSSPNPFNHAILGFNSLQTNGPSWLHGCMSSHSNNTHMGFEMQVNITTTSHPLQRDASKRKDITCEIYICIPFTHRLLK